MLTICVFFSFPPPIRTPEPEEADVEFDASLLEDTENMAANEILWNNLTAENLQALWANCYASPDKATANGSNRAS